VDCRTAYDDKTDTSVCGKHLDEQVGAQLLPLSRYWMHKRHYKGSAHLSSEGEADSSGLAGHPAATVRDEVSTYFFNAAGNSMMVKTTCTSEGTIVEATANAVTKTTESSIKVESVQPGVSNVTLPSGKLLTCSATIPTGAIAYRLDGNCLELSKQSFVKIKLVPAPSSYEE
jgi:hypothetical protein